MNIDFLRKLSNADSIAGNEGEVRNVLLDELKDFSDEVSYDGLGSVIFKKTGIKDGPKIMLCAHMDEVGFMVRSISDMGHVMLITVGGVKPLAQFMQRVRITTFEGKKIHGIIQGIYEDGKATKIYVDLGLENRQEVIDLGIDVGDMVTFTSEFEEFDGENIYCGKAFDDRLGLYVIGEVLKRVKNHPNTIYMVGTSSEEIGLKGAETSTYRVNPDVVFPIDVACFSDEFIRDHTNNRQIGKGMMLTHFDNTLSPNRYLIHLIKDSAKKLNKNLQLDMFNRGGTDGGESHKSRGGKPTAVSCLPVRYGHCAYSIVNKKDLEDAIDIFTYIIEHFDNETYEKIIDFGGRK